MITGKGLAYTVLGAAGAAVVAGMMMTGGSRSEKLKHMGSRLRDMWGSVSRKYADWSRQPAQHRAEFDQASNPGGHI